MVWGNVLEFLLFKHLNTAENHTNPGLGKHLKLWCDKECRGAHSFPSKLREKNNFL